MKRPPELSKDASAPRAPRRSLSGVFHSPANAIAHTRPLRPFTCSNSFTERLNAGSWWNQISTRPEQVGKLTHSLCFWKARAWDWEFCSWVCMCISTLAFLAKFSLCHTYTHARMHACMQSAGLEELILFQLWLQTAVVITGKLSTWECFGAEKLILPSKEPRRATKKIQSTLNSLISNVAKFKANGGAAKNEFYYFSSFYHSFWWFYVV